MDDKYFLKNNENIELRIIIIGDENVGKKTLTKRIQMLNCSETKKIEPNIILYNESKEEERKKKLQKLIYRNLSFKEIEPNENFDYRDKETILHTEYELKKEKERKKLMSIQKIYKLCNLNTIKISIYPCIEIKPIINFNLDEEKVEQPDQFEKKYKKSMKGLINEIIQIISYPMESIYDKVDYIFLFCFDLSNFNSFHNISYYYNQLNNKFNIDTNYNMALIGNKNDKKKILKEKQKNNLENFIRKINIKYYEISSFLYFNFENFLKELIFDIFENNPKYKYYNIKDFEEKFHIIINEKSTFSKSQRALHSTNIFPSPNKYNNNVFEYPLSKKTIINLFKAKNRYNKKIFVNKNGPLYPKLNQKEDKETEIKKLKYNNIMKTSFIEEKKKKFFIEEEINKKVNNYLVPYSHKPGYSIGGFHADNSLNLRQNRRKINFLKIKEISEAFDSGINLSLNNKVLKKIKSYDKKNINRLRNEIKKNKLESEKILTERHHNIKLKNESLENEKINKIIEKEKKYNKKYLQRKKKLFRSKLNYFKKALKTTLLLKSKNNDNEPKAKFYDTVSSISLKKGFSFGRRPQDKNLNLITPDYPYFLDDFEKIVQKNKNKKEIKSFSDRFPKYRTEEIGDSREKMEKKQKYFELKRKELKNNALSDFFDNMKRRKKAFTLKKKKIKEKEDEDYNILTNNKYFLTEIQYSQVETSYPKYSIKGKYKTKQVNNSDNDNIDLFDDDIFGNNKSTCKKFSFTEEEHPNIAKVRPTYPKYSFGKEARFKKTFSDIGKNINKNLDFKDNDNEENKNWLFRNGIFGYNDKTSYLKTQTYMGLGKRMTDYKDNGVPGPGQYYIKGFTDLISFRNNKKNKISKTVQNKSKKENFIS